MCELLKKHTDEAQGNQAKAWKTNATYQSIDVWVTELPNSNTNNTSIKAVG